MALFHLVLEPDWAAAEGQPLYAPRSLAQEGFVHCTGSEDVTLAVATAYFASAAAPVLVLRFDAARLGAPVRWEAPVAPSGAGALPHHAHGRLFPHVYGPIPRAAVTVVGPLRRVNGAFAWPRDA